MSDVVINHYTAITSINLIKTLLRPHIYVLGKRTVRKMSGMVAVVLKMTFGVFVNKARGSLSEKLQDGGLNSQQLRSLIVSNFDDIKTKLDGLARGNLLSSISFIQEGLGLLNDLLDKPNTPPEQGDDKVGGNSNRASNPDQASSSNKDSPVDVDSVLKLVEAIDKMKINSSDHFTSAMELFKNANTKATEAFHNESLSLEDRILAAKLRVQSRLLLSLGNPSLASQPSRLYLEELHGLASIVEVFRNYLEGGKLSFLNKEKRQELVLSVSAINFVVFKFLKSFTPGPINVFDWPNLKSGEWTYNPLIPNKAIIADLSNAGLECPNFVLLKELGVSHWRFCSVDWVAVNSDGDLIMWDGNSTLLKITMSEVKVYFTVKLLLRSPRKCFLVIDNDNITYLLVAKRGRPSATPSFHTRPCYLTAIDSNGYSTEELGEYSEEEGVKSMNSTPDGFVVVTGNRRSTHEVEFYKNNKGIIEPTYSFEIKLWVFSLTTVTNKYQLVAVEKYGHRVRVYEKDGQLIREFELYAGDRESCVSIAFNYLTEELVFVSRVGSWYFLSTYEPETGKRRHNVRLTLFGKEKQDLRLTAHCSGPMALVSREYALYLQ